MIGCSKENRENFSKKMLLSNEKESQKPGLKYNPGLALKQPLGNLARPKQGFKRCLLLKNQA